MRPRGWLSRWVKVRPWYYTERSSLASRSRADADAIEADWRAVADDLQSAIDAYEPERQSADSSRGPET